MKYFKMDEFQCKCGKCPKKDISQEFQDIMDSLRTIMNKPIKITSGIRCAEHNKAIGGAPNSQHVNAIAVDISTVGWSSEDKYNLVKHALNLGFGGIGIAETFIHVDIRKVNRAVWNYGNKNV